MTRHSFIRISNLTDVQGRADYISNPKRQEHLYATYSTVEPEFWKYLSEQSQYDFWKSNQPNGKCIEARELIIALPECLQASDPNLLLQLFTEKFREQYGVQCTAALHHNKTMINYHIHLIFADRDVLEKTEVKCASRNMYYDEEGHHVRTKKEVLGDDGKLRPGCRMIPKGEAYEIKWFSGRKECFKSKAFVNDVKVMFTELINQCVVRETDKLMVFDPDGPYLATKKIGKNNPKAEEIRADNEVKREWNQIVDQVLIAGGTIEEVTDFKQKEVAQKIDSSIKEHGYEPELLASLIKRAIAVLKEFLNFLMEHEELLREELNCQEETLAQNENMPHKAPRPDSGNEELEFHKMEEIYQRLIKANRKTYALQKQRESVMMALEQIPDNIIHRKERKALQDRMDGLDRQLALTHNTIDSILEQSGFKNVKAAKQAFQDAKKALEEVRIRQAEWDGVAHPIIQKPKTRKAKISVLKQLAEKQLMVSGQSVKSNKRNAPEL